MPEPDPAPEPIDPSIFRVLEVEGGFLVVPGNLRWPTFGTMEAEPEVGYFIPNAVGSGSATSIPLPPDWEEGLP